MVIFLDIDGVLNQLQPYRIDINCVKCLSKICRHFDASVVLTSSWRLGYSRDFNKCTKQIQDLIETFRKYNIDIIGRTKSLSCRAREVETYIQEHNVYNYIILDDDISEFSYKISNLYIVNYKTGLIEKDVKKLLRE